MTEGLLMNDCDIVVSFITNNPVFSNLTPIDKSRFISQISVKKYSAGAIVHNNSDQTDSGFFLVSGSVDLKAANSEKKISSGNFFSCEGVLGLNVHVSKAVCLDESVIISIPAATLKNLEKTSPDIVGYFSSNILENLGVIGKSASPALKNISSIAASGLDFQGSIWGWIAMLVGTPLFYFYAKTLTISSDARIFLTFLLASVFMWLFRLVPDYIPALFTILGTLAVDIAPVKTVLTGFSSESFVMIMCLSAISLVAINSGILYRSLVKLLSISMKSYNFYNFILFIIGIILTLFVPSIITRCQIIAQLTNEARSILHVKKTDTFSTSIAVTGFYGASILSTVFFTGSLLNFLVQDMLPTQEQTQFQSLGWLKASMVMGAVLVVGYLVAFFAIFHNTEKCELKKEVLVSKLEVMGKVSLIEWCSIISVVFLSVGFFTYFDHQIHPAWVATIAMVALAALGAFNKKDLQIGIDWPLIIFIATCSGIASTMNYLGLNLLAAKSLMEFLGTGFNDPLYFIMLTIGTTLILRLFLPIIPSVLILCTFFVPIAGFYNISPWLTAIVVLSVADMWFLPHQNVFYLLFEEWSGGNYDQKKFVLFNMIMNIVRLAAIYLSMPYWSKLGLM